MLVDLWEEVLSVMEGGKCAGVLFGIGFEKKASFNRMDHQVCLSELKELGASQGSILSLVRAFLEDRAMTISIGGHSPDPVGISRGELLASPTNGVETTSHEAPGIALARVPREGSTKSTLTATSSFGRTPPSART